MSTITSILAYEDNKIPKIRKVYGIDNTKPKPVFDMPVSDSEIYPMEAVVRWKRTGEFGLIKSYTFQHEQKGFMNYLVQVEGKEGLYCWFHDDVYLECLPKKNEQ